MRKLTVLLFVVAMAPALLQAMSVTQIREYLFRNSINPDEALIKGKYTLRPHKEGVKVQKWHLPVPRPKEADLLPEADAAAAVSAARQAAREAAANAAQQAQHDSKPQAQKALENKFFAVSKQALELAGDPRALVEPVPKMTFVELRDLLDAVDPSSKDEAVALLLHLLAVNADLVRFNAKWWAIAQTHTIEE